MSIIEIVQSLPSHCAMMAQLSLHQEEGGCHHRTMKCMGAGIAQLGSLMLRLWPEVEVARRYEKVL